MKATLISHTYITPMNQAKIQAMTQFFSDVHLIVPSMVKDTLRTMKFVEMKGAKFKSSQINSYFDFHNSTRIYNPIQLSKALENVKSDVWIIEQEPYSLSTLQILLKKKKMGVLTLLYSFQNIYKKYPQPFSWVEKKCLELADGLIVGSESAAEVWKNKGYPIQKIHILPQVGVDLDFFEVKEASQARKNISINDIKTFGFAGRLVEEKGVQVLLQAAAILKNREFQVLIVGKGPYEKNLRELVKSLGIEQKVIFVGAPTHEKMPQYLQAMDVLVLPSLIRPHWREQFGHVLIEAMSCERPCLGSDSDPIYKIIEGCGYSFKEGSSEDLALKMEKMLNNPLELSAMAKKARQVVGEKYTNQVIAQKLYQLSLNLNDKN